MTAPKERSIGTLERVAFDGAALLLCALVAGGFWAWFAPPWPMRLASVLLALGVFSLWHPYREWLQPQTGLAVRALTTADRDESRQMSALLKKLAALGFAEGVEQPRMLGEKYRNWRHVQ